MDRDTYSDGHVREAVACEIKIGIVVRRVSDDGGISPFSDTVVIGMDKADEYGCVLVHLARPYLYADNIGGNMPNWLQGVERYTCGLNTLLSTYYVVEMSDGKLATYNNQR